MIGTRRYKKKLIVVIAILLIIIGAFSGCISPTPKHVSHLGVMTGVLEKEQVKVFYRLLSRTQKSLAQQNLDLIYSEYEICSDILNLSIRDLYSCSLVFCKSQLDPYILRCKWVGYIDGVLCWPIIGEDSMQFKTPVNGWLLYHMLPHEIVDMTLRVTKEVDYIYGAWFIEGVSEYSRLMAAKYLDKLNETFFTDMINNQFIDLSRQETRVVNLSNRSTFEGFGVPGSEDEHVFYVGSLIYIYFLVDLFGEEFISDVVANGCKSYEEIRSSIENSTGYNISDTIMNVQVGWIKEQYMKILKELNVDY